MAYFAVEDDKKIDDRGAERSTGKNEALADNLPLASF